MPEIVPGGRIAVIGSYVLTGFFEMTDVLGSFQGNFGDALPIFSLLPALLFIPPLHTFLHGHLALQAEKSPGKAVYPEVESTNESMSLQAFIVLTGSCVDEEE